MNQYQSRIELLRELMRARGYNAVVIGGSDPHSTEYPAARWKQVEWLTGFTGEAGDVVVTLDHAGLWTDTRYFIQAVRQLSGTEVQLHKTRVPEQVLIPEWLRSEFGEDAVVAIDGLCFSAEAAAELPGTLVSVPDLLSVLWTDRPSIPQTTIESIDSSAGESREQKIHWLRSQLLSHKADAIFLSKLDEIAWLLNVRASDIECNPFAISYLLVSQEAAFWYVQKEDAEDELSVACFAQLEEQGIEILPYSEAETVPSSCEGTLWLDSQSLNFDFFSRREEDIYHTIDEPSPIPLRKAVKNEGEIEAMRAAHLKDGIAVERFLYWLEQSLEQGQTVSEWDAAEKLARFRSEYDEYRGDSFETISAYGPGAALPHYITPRQDAPEIKRGGLYLCDSGGQYSIGTTDITRTIPTGECSQLEKEDYSLVLKGHIALAMAVFPAGTAGCQIDALAREPLWKARRNFGHGTGHGVGFWLGVHEGPQDIRQNFNSTPLLPGMIVSNEPGLYREGQHGVRHENLLLVVELPDSEFGSWRAFEPLTLCHFDTSILLPGILSPEETDWLNSYHERVYRSLSPYLSDPERAWLRSKTQAIQCQHIQDESKPESIQAPSNPNPQAIL